MDIEEIKLKYKTIPLARRLGAVIGLGLLLPALYGWIFTDIGAIEGRKSEAMQEKSSSETQLQKFIEQKKDAPRLEEQLKFTESEMAEARQRLPSDYFLDLMIQRLGLLANKAKVTLKLFSPGEESVIQGPAPYVEMPIKLKVAGGYNEIAQFYDAIVHFDTMIHIRNMDLKPELTGPESGSQKATIGEQATDVAQKFEMEVKKHQVVSTMVLVLFRSMRPDEPSMGSSNAAGAPEASASSPKDKLKSVPSGQPPPASPQTTPAPANGGD